MRYAVVAAVLLVTAAAVAVAVARGGPSPEPGEPAAGPATGASSPAASTSTRAELDLSDLPIARAPFCPLVDDDEVSEALDADIDGTDSYEPGDTVRVAPGVRDVAHEYSCSFEGSGAEARVWVFAAPVSTPRARGLVRELRGEQGCEAAPTGTTYGTPGLTRVCTGDGEVGASLRGLFGDTWVTCEVTDRGGPGDVEAVESRAEQWCVHVATTLGAR
jgi:hypothetical protein